MADTTELALLKETERAALDSLTAAVIGAIQRGRTRRNVQVVRVFGDSPGRGVSIGTYVTGTIGDDDLLVYPDSFARPGVVFGSEIGALVKGRQTAIVVPFAEALPAIRDYYAGLAK